MAQVRMPTIKCYKCGKYSTIVEITMADSAAIKDGYTHYCCSRIDAQLPNKKLQYGNENGCGQYIRPSIFGQLDSFDTQLHVIKAPEIVPLDPWGAPVDKRGYPT